MKISYKLILSYVLVALVASLMIWFALGSYRNINQEFEDLARQRIPVIKALEEIRQADAQVADSTGDFFAVSGEDQAAAEAMRRNPEKTRALREKLDLRSYREYDEAIKRYENLVASHPASGRFSRTIREESSRLVGLSRQIIELDQKNAATKDLFAIKSQFDEQRNSSRQAMDAALTHEYEQLLEAQESIQAEALSSTQSTYVIVLLTFLLAIGSGFYISRLFARRIVKLKEASALVGDGELEMQLDDRSGDEIGDLTRSFNEMVGDLRKSRSELATARQFEDKVMDAMVDFVVVVDMDLKIVRVNRACLRMNGYAEHELIGQPVNLLVADRPFTQHGVEIIRQKGMIVNFDKLNRNKDGTVTPISMSMSILKDDRGQELGIVCVGKDVTELNRRETERQAITGIVRNVMLSSSLEELYKIAHESIAKIISAENCFIALYHPQTDTLTFDYWVDAHDPRPAPRVPARSLASYIIRTGKNLRWTDETKAELAAAGGYATEGTGFASWIGVPLRIGPQTVGVLAVQHYEKKDLYSRHDLEILAAVGDQLGLAIERKRRELELRNNELQLSESQRIAGVGSWQWDITTNQVSWSAELYRIYGLDPAEAEITYQLMLEFIHPDDLEMFEKNVAGGVADRFFPRFDYRIVRHDGTVRTVHTNGQLVFDEAGEVAGIHGTAQDVTGQKEAEDKLAQLSGEVDLQNQRMSNIIANMPGVVWETIIVEDARKQTVNFVSEQITAMTGYTVEEWQSTPNFWLQIIHPDDMADIEAEAAKNYAEGKGSIHEFRWTAKDGRTVWVESRSDIIFDDVGRSIGLRGVTLDISERKKIEETLRNSEARHRLLFETNPQPSYAYDLETLRFLAVNEAAVRQYGFSREEFLERITLRDIRPPEEIPDLLERVRRITPDQDTILAPSRHRKKDGTVMDVEITSHQLAFNGRPAEIVLVNDVTERRRAEEQLKIYNQKLQQSNRELEDFAYVASHDLQEPLRKVQAFADRLGSKYADRLDATGLDYLERMRSAGQRMQTLIQDLLTFSRISTKAQPFVPVDLGQITREVLSDLEVKIEETAARVEIENLPVLEADPLQMRQLMQNLIGNALKFRRPGAAPQIEISAAHGCGSLENGAGVWRICVKDNGIGFDEKYLDRIFTVFQRLHGRTDYEGSGVGLAVCRKIAERHRGGITAQSRPGEGAEFVVTLPARQ